MALRQLRRHSRARSMVLPTWRGVRRLALGEREAPTALVDAKLLRESGVPPSGLPPKPSVPSAPVSAWLPEDAEVGITGVVAAAGGALWLFEVAVRLPGERRSWRALRDLAAFERLDAALRASFGDAMRARQVAALPRPARLSWEAARRIRGPASVQAAVPTRLERLRPQLNAYLHKLLEIDAVLASAAFREFLAPNAAAMDVEMSGDAFPDQLLAPRSKCLSQPALLRSISTGPPLEAAANSVLTPKARKRSLPRSSSARRRSSTSTSAGGARLSLVARLSDAVRNADYEPDSTGFAPHTASQCSHLLHYGGKLELAALGGLGVGLTKRSAISGSYKAAAMAAAGVAGVALTGPLSAMLALGALGSGVGKYHLNKAHYLTLDNPSQRPTPPPNQRQNSGGKASKKDTADVSSHRHSFLIETAEQFSGPHRPVRFGDSVHLYCQQIRKMVRIAAPADSKRGHLMVTGTKSHKSTTLRLVSPYEQTGPIRCGSHVMLQVVDGEFEGELVGLHGDMLATGASPVVFHLRDPSTGNEHANTCPEIHTHRRRGGNGHLPRHHQSSSSSVSTSSSLSSLSSLSSMLMQSPRVSQSSGIVTTTATTPTTTLGKVLDTTPFSLRVMTYNVWLLPSIVASFSDKLSPSALQRAQAIPRCLALLELDVVVFCEAFDGAARELLIAGMKAQGFLYETRAIGANASFLSSKKAIDSGCFAMSRYPIYAFQERAFGSIAAGDDRMADKGMLYFQVRIPIGDKDQPESFQYVHVVGTHLQAWETPTAVATRASQLQLMRDFMDSLEIPEDEPVVIAGDMNVNNVEGSDMREYEAMLEALDAVDPPLDPESSEFSFDPLTNSLAVDGPSSGGITERLDYVMLRRSHRQPVEACACVVPLKATPDWHPSVLAGDGELLVDLSDHYPVVAELRF